MSAAAQKSDYPWVRWWLPSGSTIMVDHSGLISDPASGHGRMFVKGARRLSELQDYRILGLEGDAGLGKSRAVEVAVAAARAAEDVTLLIRATHYNSAAELCSAAREALRQTPTSAQTKATVYVDGVDEVPFGDSLAPLVDELPENSRLRIVCRASAWPGRLKASLERSEYETAFYELLPLTLADIRVAARIDEVDDVAFLAAVLQRNVGVLASRPLTLRELLAEFGNRGTLPASRRQLFREACRRHCDEQNLARRSRDLDRATTSVDQRLAILERVATYSLLCDRRSVDLGPVGISSGANPHAISVADITGGAERACDSEFQVGERAIVETLERCGFMSAAPPSGIAFSHRQWAEFLTAEYVCNKNLPLQQLTSLVSHPRRPDRVAQPLRGLASELAGSRLDFARWLLAHDASAILGADLSDFPASAKQKFVDILLSKAEELAFADAFGSRHVLSTLSYPGLVAVLRAVIAATKLPVSVRNLAIDVGASCRLVDLANDMTNIALEPNEPRALRMSAMQGLLGMGAKEVARRLEPLLREPDDDPYEGMKGLVLELLWPEHLSSPFAFLDPPVSPHHSGSYSQFLSSTLPRRLNIGLLPLALGWATTTSIREHEDYALARARDAILRFAWANAELAEILPGLTALLTLLVHQYENLCPQEPSYDTDKDQPDWFPLTATRRLVVAALCATTQTTSNANERPVIPADLLWSNPPLIVPADLEWLLDKACASTFAAESAQWLAAATSVFWADVNASSADVLARKAESSDDVRAAFPSFIALQSEEEAKSRAAHLRLSEISVLRAKVTQSVRETTLEQVLDRFDEKGPLEWPNILKHLELPKKPSRSTTDDAVQVALSLAEPVRARVVSAAERYLAEHEPKVPSPGDGRHAGGAFTDYAALRIASLSIGGRPATISDTLCARYAASIVGWMADARDDQDAFLLAAASRADSHRLVAAIEHRILAENRWYESTSVLSHLSIWNAAVEEMVFRLVPRDDLFPSTVGQLLEVAALHGSARAFAAGRQLIDAGVSAPPEAREHELALAASMALLQADSRRVWSDIAMLMREASAFAGRIFERIASQSRRSHPASLVRALAAEELGELYLWLTDRFPPSSDPDIDAPGAAAPREAIADFRDGLLSDRSAKPGCEAREIVLTTSRASS